MKADWRASLDAEFEAGKDYKPNKADWLDGHWAGLRRAGEDATTIAPRRDRRRARGAQARSAAALTTVPESFNVHKTIQRLLDDAPQDDRDRRGHRLGDRRGAGLRHAAATRAIRVRLSGQDVERGTFSQRHSRAHRPGDRGALHAAQPHPRGPGATTRSSTRCSRKRRCSASSTATRWPSRTR